MMKKFSELSKTKRLFLIIFALCFVHTSSGIKILYLQETAKAYTEGARYSSAELSTLTTSFPASMQYTMSTWVQITTQPSNWTVIFRLSQNTSSDLSSGRILLATINPYVNYTFVIATPTIDSSLWASWEDLTEEEMFPTGKWVFLALGTDSTANMQYGFRYYPQSTTQLTAFFKTQTIPCPSYNVTPSCTAFWGGDNFYTSPGQILQYVRLYIDYVPTSQDEMINLALMQQGGTLYYLLLTTDYEDVQNSTFPIQYYQDTSQGFDTAYINSNHPVTFGPFNMIMCRSGAVLSYDAGPSYDAGTSNANGIIIAFDIRIYPSGNTIQNLFSMRDNSNNYVSLTTYYDPADRFIKVQLQNPNWNLVYTSSTAINFDQWNRVVVELQLSNPNSFGIGFYSGRIFVNHTSIPYRTYFGNFSSAPLLEDHSKLTLDICSTMGSGTATLNSSIGGNYDMMNLMWYYGDESLYQNSSDPTCHLSGFLNPNQSACLICNPGYYLDGRKCVSSCSTNEFVDSDTSSCQSCYYSSRYYTNTGYCLPCNSTNQLISNSSCIICDNTCASCSGPSSTQCTSCYSGSYLKSGNFSCVACNFNGYYISGSQCLKCNSSCLTCNGSLATNCLSCPSEAYLLTSNNSCVACNVSGYYISGSQCLQCNSSCLTCNGSLATNCLSCPSEAYLLTSNNSCVACNVSGYYISGSQCKQCDNTCQACSGSPTDCLSCPSEAYLLTPKNSCVACNVSGYYISGSQCKQCDNTCQACSGSPTDCLTCPSGTYLLSANNSCVACNVSGYYISGSQCKKCDNTCQACSGSPTDCLSCPSGTYLLSANDSCVACNVSGYYISGSQCKQCDNTCQACSGSSTDCLSCPSGTYLLSANNSCVACNVSGYYISGSQCKKCDNTCQACSGSPTDCLSCPSGTYLLSANNSCVACNVSGYYISGSQCKQCDYTCQTCSESLATNCLTCPSGAYLVSANNSCVSCQVNGYHISGSQCLEDTLINNLASSGGEVTAIAAQAQSLASSVLPAILGGVSTSAMLLVGFLGDVNLYMYINVAFPDNFVSFGQKISSSTLPNIFANMDVVNHGDNPNSTIGKFQFWGVSATLLDDSYASIGKELITLAIILGLNILVLILKGCPSLHQVACKIRRVFMWNLFLSYYLGDFSELQLNSMIQMRENYVSSAYADLSLAFAVIIVATYPLLFGFMIYKLNRKLPEKHKFQNNSKGQESNNSRARKEREYMVTSSENQPIEKWAEVPHSIQIIAEDFKDKNIYTRNYLLIMLLETFSVILIDFFLQDYGLAQAILYTMIVLIFLSLAAWQRPYKTVFQMFILLLDLSAKTVMGIIAIILGINEKSAFISSQIIETMGLMLISLILIVIGINVVISLVIMVVSLYLEYQKWRAKHKRDPSNTHHKGTNIADRRNDNSMDELNESQSAKISLKFYNSSVLQDSNHIQHQNFQKDKKQSISQTRPIPLISETQATNLPGSEITQKKTDTSYPYMKAPIRGIKKRNFDNQAVLNIKPNSSMDVNIGLYLQASNHIQHQSFQKDEEQSISQARSIPLISETQATNLPGSERALNETKTSNPYMKTPIRTIKRGHFDNQTIFDIKLNSSMDVNIGLDLQASNNIQHQSFQKYEEQSILQERPIRVISKTRRIDSPESEIAQKKTTDNTSNPKTKAPIKVIKRGHFDNQTVFDLKPEPLLKENLRKKDKLK